LAVLALQLVLSLPATRRPQLADFVSYYGAGSVILAGEPERLYSTERKLFTSLPVVALAFAPLAALDYRSAWDLFWWIRVACFASTCALVLAGAARHLAPLGAAGAALAGAILLAFGPVLRDALRLGQTTPLALPFVALLWLAARAGRPRLAGAALGVVCLIKLPPLAWLAIFALRRRTALVASALAVLAAGVLVSWLAFGGELLRQYAQLVIAESIGRSHGAFNNRSLVGAFTRLLSDRGLLDFAFEPRPLSVTLAVAASGAALLGLYAARGAAALCWPARPPRDGDPRTGSLELELALGAALMLLFFPIAWAHYYLLLAVPLALLPAWWRRGALPLAPLPLALLALGTWLASGSEVPGNVEVAARGAERGFRLAQDAQTLGALLLAVGLSTPLAVLARREREPPQGA
jgi:hypothetical protein